MSMQSQADNLEEILQSRSSQHQRSPIKGSQDDQFKLFGESDSVLEDIIVAKLIASGEFSFMENNFTHENQSKKATKPDKVLTF